MDEHSSALALALVYAHVKDGDEYTSYVYPHKVRRKRRRQVPDIKFNREERMVQEFIPLKWEMVPEEVWIGGHVRRKAMYRRTTITHWRDCGTITRKG